MEVTELLLQHGASRGLCDMTLACAAVKIDKLYNYSVLSKRPSGAALAGKCQWNLVVEEARIYDEYIIS